MTECCSASLYFSELSDNILLLYVENKNKIIKYLKSLEENIKILIFIYLYWIYVEFGWWNLTFHILIFSYIWDHFSRWINELLLSSLTGKIKSPPHNCWRGQASAHSGRTYSKIRMIRREDWHIKIRNNKNKINEKKKRS